MDTITLQEALAGFTANESAALGSYIGLSSGGAGQKQSIAALAKVAGEQINTWYCNGINSGGSKFLIITKGTYRPFKANVICYCLGSCCSFTIVSGGNTFSDIQVTRTGRHVSGMRLYYSGTKLVLSCQDDGTNSKIISEVISSTKPSEYEVVTTYDVSDMTEYTF